MKAIVEGILKVASVSSNKKKYNHLIAKMTSLGLLNTENCFAPLSNAIKIVYVQPNKKNCGTESVIDFEWIAQWIDKHYGQSEFGKVFSETLSHWAND